MGELFLREGWKIISTSDTTGKGAEISKPGFPDEKWMEAYVPSTVMGILSQANGMENLMMADEYYAFDKTIFDKPWWYRKQFEIKNFAEAQTVLLVFDGISFSANIWINGHQIASSDKTSGTFRRFAFDISQYANKGDNVLAIEVFRQQAGDFGHGFVDWNPRPHDESMGLWRDVSVKVFDKVEVKNTFVSSKVNLETLDEAWLTISAEIQNYSEHAVSGNLKFDLNNSGFSMPVSLKAGEMKTIVTDANIFAELHVMNPKLWWCADFGEPNLHRAKVSFEIEGSMCSSETVSYGIRQIDDYFTDEGYRGYKLNGKKVLIKGAGWTDDIFLRDTDQTNEVQVQYVRDMGMNTIRFEHIWGKSRNIYELCDRYGLLAMVGWTCHWEWDYYLGKPSDDFGGAASDEDFDLLVDYLEHQVKWLRNHPSIFVWLFGSDKLPRPDLEKRYLALLSKIDPSRPCLGAASYRVSEISGPTGVKMHGPYEYVGPSYWYIDKKYGGAYSFNTETGPGTQIPVKESIERMFPPDKRWPLNETWDKHCTTASLAMNKIGLHKSIVDKMWGEAKSFDDFIAKSHLVNYEAMRPMFEAFRANRHHATGIIQWMLNSAWPSLYWQLYDFYLVPTPAYYATKKALEQVQLIYNYGDHTLWVSNEGLIKKNGMRGVVKVYSHKSDLLWQKEVEITIDGNSSKQLLNLPRWDELVFLDLELFGTGNELLADNFYWLSAQKELYDWDATNWVHTPMKQYGDFMVLEGITGAKVEVEVEVKADRVSVVVENVTERLSFFNQIKIHNGDGQWIVPAFYSDNYFSLVPGSKKRIDIKLHEYKNEKLFIELRAWNSRAQTIEI